MDPDAQRLTRFRPPLRARMTTWLLRGVLGLCVCLVIAVAATANLSGKGDLQRRGLEGMLSNMIGFPVEVHRLNNYQLFPTLLVDFGDTVALDRVLRTPVVVIEEGYYAQDFIERFFGDYPIMDLRARNILMRPGFLGGYPVHIKKAEIDKIEPGQTQTTFTMEGFYGAMPMRLTLPMDIKTVKAGVLFRFVADRPIVLRIGSMQTDLFLKITPQEITLMSPRVMWAQSEMAFTLTARHPIDQPEKIDYTLDVTNLRGCGDATALRAEMQRSDFSLSLSPLTLYQGDQVVAQGKMTWAAEKPPVFTWDSGSQDKGRALESCLR